MTIVEQIEAATASPATKITQLYAVVILHYRQPLGDAAWAAMERVTGNREYVDALALLMGMTMGARAAAFGPTTDNRAIWERLLSLPLHA